jgi:serine/threonine-protein kinase ATR
VENVLLDATTGDCVHVDFSCLFDKGLELETPEVVPFRLTQNMIDGLGVGGYEGAFERVCEITLDVLRNHREALMSVLETFVHDPLVEWTRGKSSSNQSNTNVVSQRKAKEALENIGARLEGVVVGVGAAPSLPLSTSGQVRRLIEEATSLVN